MRHALMALFLVDLLFIVVVLPRKISLFLGRILGIWACHLTPRYRKRVRDNIGQAFKDKSLNEVREIRDGSFKNMGANIVDFALMNFRSKKFWLKRITMVGEKNLKKNISAGKGVVYLTAHISNWELMGGYLSMIGYPINVIARKMTDEMLDNLLVGLRGRRGVNTIYRTGSGNMKSMVKVLKAGEVLGILIDQDTKVGGVFVDFFGRPAYTPTAVSQFGKLDNTVILPGFIYRKPDDSYVIEVGSPISKDGTAKEQTARHTKIIENYIRKYPKQWVWMHRRWKTKKV